HTLPNIDFSANDVDANGDPMQIEIVIGPDHGTLTQNTDGTYDYAPDEAWVGDDTVYVRRAPEYGYGPFDMVGVTISVTGIAPVVRDTAVPLEAYNGTYSDIAFLANVTDADADTLTIDIVSGPQHGSLDFNTSTGLYDYNATSSYLGRDSFSVRYYDGAHYSQ